MKLEKTLGAAALVGLTTACEVEFPWQEEELTNAECHDRISDPSADVETDIFVAPYEGDDLRIEKISLEGFGLDDTPSWEEFPYVSESGQIFVLTTPNTYRNDAVRYFGAVTNLGDDVNVLTEDQVRQNIVSVVDDNGPEPVILETETLVTGFSLKDQVSLVGVDDFTVFVTSEDCDSHKMMPLHLGFFEGEDGKTYAEEISEEDTGL